MADPVISGYFHPRSPRWPQPSVDVAVRLPGIQDEYRSISFLIDTGAALTLLHPRDALGRLGFTREQLETPQSWPRQGTYGLGGATTNYVVPAWYRFRLDTDDEIEVRLRILVAQRTEGNRTYPSLLGWDLLRHFRLTTDWPRMVVLRPEHALRT
jgi:hypothetical protein